VDRCSLGRIAEDGTIVGLAHSVGSDSIPAPLGLDAHDYPWYVAQLRSGRTIQFSRLPDDLPAEAAAEREFFRQRGIRSHLDIPLMTDQRLWGRIAFASFLQPRLWTDEEVQRLRLAGEIMMEALLRREAEEAARRRRDELTHVGRVAALGELTAALAHELNQPLAAICTNAQATRRLLAAGRSPDDLMDVLDDIVADATRAADLIRRLRDLLRRRELEKVPLDINQVVLDVQPIADTEARRHGARLLLQLAAGLPRISGDAVQLQQILLNLVRNAAEAMVDIPPDAREVVVRTFQMPEHLTMTVEDNGPPIDEATLRHLFTPFHTTKAEGLGMGLAISRSIVEAHGGRLWAERRPKGGLVVQCSLPTELIEGAVSEWSAQTSRPV
jgi:C4-dicarboxylate-specific signal transduction histidine kinase